MEDWVHDGEHNLIAARKCLAGLKSIIWRIVEKYEFKPGHKLNLNYTGVNALRMRQSHDHHMNAESIT